MINGHEAKPKIRQVINCGAAIKLDDAVIEHGVVFVHPELPPMKLYLKLDPEGKKLPAYHMEPVTPEHGAQTQYAICVHEVAEPVIAVPEKKLILPN